jgi:hypothetical protein
LPLKTFVSMLIEAGEFPSAPLYALSTSGLT